jgi:DNA-binding MarR family transcriptional regulator
VPDREPIAYRLARAIKRARRQMTNAIREQLDPTEMSLHAVQVIKQVVTRGQLNQLELARDTEQEPAGLCRLVADLEAKHMVARRRDPDDNRCVLVAATPEGEAQLARAQPRVLAGIESMTSRLTRAEQATLCDLLEKLAPDDEAAAGGVPDLRGAASRSPRSGSGSREGERPRLPSPTRRARGGRPPTSLSATKQGAKTSSKA